MVRPPHPDGEKAGWVVGKSLLSAIGVVRCRWPISFLRNHDLFSIGYGVPCPDSATNPRSYDEMTVSQDSFRSHQLPYGDTKRHGAPPLPQHRNIYQGGMRGAMPIRHSGIRMNPSTAEE